MADLPPWRLQSFERPFYNTDIDYFGPFMIKQGRSLWMRVYMSNYESCSHRNCEFLDSRHVY